MALQISFKSRRLRQLCVSSTRARRLLGPETANRLQAILGDLEAVDTLADMLLPSENSCDLEGIITLPLTPDVSMTISANHNSVPLLSNGNIDWTRVSRIKIISIGEYQ